MKTWERRGQRSHTWAVVLVKVHVSFKAFSWNIKYFRLLNVMKGFQRLCKRKIPGMFWMLHSFHSGYRSTKMMRFALQHLHEKVKKINKWMSKELCFLKASKSVYYWRNKKGTQQNVLIEAKLKRNRSKKITKTFTWRFTVWIAGQWQCGLPLLLLLQPPAASRNLMMKSIHSSDWRNKLRFAGAWKPGSTAQGVRSSITYWWRTRNWR